jgi:uncharacterized protein
VIFVDTSAWYAAIVADDPNHADATRWLRVNRTALLTTDYVADETLTLLKARGQYRRALELGESLFRGEVATLYAVTPADLRAGWETFRRFADKDWSFTDCVSKVVVDRLAIPEAFAFDDHFRQFATVCVVPSIS